jgi:hypothetical protein
MLQGMKSGSFQSVLSERYTMIRITRIETTYPAPADDEEDYCPDGESTSTDDTVSFRELVDLMRDYPLPSCSHARGETFEWLSSESQQDPYSGEWTEQSIHYSRENPPRAAKYWRAAMRAAGIAR